MDFSLLNSLLSTLLLLVFLGIVYWAYCGANRQRFLDDAMLPFDDEGPLPTTGSAAGDEALGQGAVGGHK